MVGTMQCSTRTKPIEQPYRLHQLSRASRSTVKVQAIAQPQQPEKRADKVVSRSVATRTPLTTVQPSSKGPRPPVDREHSRSHETDYVVIGSGIGGACLAISVAVTSEES